MAELGAGSGTSYPASLDVDNTVEVNASTTARADVPNDLAAAIIAVQTELGTDPAGSMTDVKTFLQTEHSTDGTHSNLSVDNITISGELIQKVGSDVSSASDLDITPAGNFFDITGTTTIATMKSKGVGTQVTLQFDGACQLTHDATNFDLPGGANITTAAGDQFTFYEYATADWRCIGYALASGKSIVGTFSSSATTSATGLVEIATQAEVNTGTDTARSITPETLAAYLLRGRVLQIVETVSSAFSSGTAIIPQDDTIPQIGEGTEFMTLAITPVSASSTLSIEVNAQVSNNAGTRYSVGALFVGSTSNALAAAGCINYFGGVLSTMILRHSVASASTSARTYRFRASGNAGTLGFNGASTARLYGGITKSSIRIVEYL